MKFKNYQDLKNTILRLESVDIITRDEIDKLLSQYTFDSKYISYSNYDLINNYFEILGHGFFKLVFNDLKTLHYIEFPSRKGGIPKNNIHAPNNINSIKYFLDYCFDYWKEDITKSIKENKITSLKNFSFETKVKKFLNGYEGIEYDIYTHHVYFTHSNFNYSLRRDEFESIFANNDGEELKNLLNLMIEFGKFKKFETLNVKFKFNG